MCCFVAARITIVVAYWIEKHVHWIFQCWSYSSSSLCCLAQALYWRVIGDHNIKYLNVLSDPAFGLSWKEFCLNTKVSVGLKLNYIGISEIHTSSVKIKKDWSVCLSSLYMKIVWIHLGQEIAKMCNALAKIDIGHIQYKLSSNKYMYSL